MECEQLELLGLNCRSRTECLRLMLALAARKFSDRRLTIAQWRQMKKEGIIGGSKSLMRLLKILQVAFAFLNNPLFHAISPLNFLQKISMSCKAMQLNA